MPAKKIAIELSNFNKLQILRRQLDDRTKEFEEIESAMRELLVYVKEVDFLKSISPAYTHLDSSEQEGQVETMDSRRNELFDLINQLQTMIPDLEKTAKGGISQGAEQNSSDIGSSGGGIMRNAIDSSPSPATGVDEKGKKPMSFDDFRKKFPSSGV